MTLGSLSGMGGCLPGEWPQRFGDGVAVVPKLGSKVRYGERPRRGMRIRRCSTPARGQRAGAQSRYLLHGDFLSPPHTGSYSFPFTTVCPVSVHT